MSKRYFLAHFGNPKQGPYTYTEALQIADSMRYEKPVAIFHEDESSHFATIPSILGPDPERSWGNEC